jgi:hypothetical protein
VWSSSTFVDHAAHVAQAIREERTVRTVEELDALPMETMIRDNEGDPWLRRADAGWECHFNLARVGIADYLPALVLWTPGDEQ